MIQIDLKQWHFRTKEAILRVHPAQARIHWGFEWIGSESGAGDGLKNKTGWDLWFPTHSLERTEWMGHGAGFRPQVKAR
jgi:hypothetical protein